MASSDDLVPFKGGFSGSRRVWLTLLELEALGARFELVEPDRFRVIPPSVLSPDTTQFLRAHRADARAIVAYACRVCREEEMEAQPV